MIKKTVKKLLACIMVVLVLMGSLPMAVISAETMVTDDGFEYEVANEAVTITGYTGTETEIVIPEEIDGLAVTEIGDSAFEKKTEITGVSLPSTLVTLSDNAFGGCTALTSVVIPDSVTAIGGRAFENCVSLKNVVLSKNLKELGNRAFNSTAIESIEIPRSLDKASTYITSTSYNFDGKTYYVDQGPFVLCENLKTVTFEKGTTQIAENLFAGAVGLEEIIIPDTVTVIENGAFASCLRLDNVVIPDSVTTIDGCAFEKCVSLKNVVLSKNLKELGNRAFNSTAIESIEIPRSLDKASTYIGSTSYSYDGKTYYVDQGPFVLCENLKTVTFEEGTTQIAEDLFAGAVGIEEIVIPDTVTIIENSAFNSCLRLTEVTIPESVTVIADSAFRNCVSMTEIVIPDSVEELEEEVFYDCISLTDVTLPEDLTVLNDDTFNGCTALETITLPSTLTEIGNDVFSGCTALKEVTVPENVEEIGSGVFQNCVSLEKVTIPQSTKKLGNSAFAGCEALTTVDIADYSITSIEYDTFKDCFALEEIQLPKGLTTIKKQAFLNNIALFDVIIPESVTSIDSTAFSYPSKTTIYSQTGSYVEEFANEGGFTFVDNVTEADAISLANASDVINLKLGEKFRLEFNANPNDVNEVITLTGSNGFVDIQGHDLETNYWSGTTVITATTGSGATYTFTVNVRKVDKIEIVAEPAKTVYNVGEELDLTGLLVQSQYDDEYTEEITDYTVTGFDSTKAGKAIVTVGWTDLTGTTHTETFEIEIVDPDAYALGDVNLDGSLNVRDATAIQKHVASMITFSDEALALADFNGDTAVNVKDATAIQKKIAGLL